MDCVTLKFSQGDLGCFNRYCGQSVHYSLIIRDLAFRLSNGIGTYKSMKNTRNIRKLDEKYVLTREIVEASMFRHELKI